MLARFGRWDGAIAELMPPPDVPVATALANYARGVAFAAKGQWGEAQAMLDAVSKTAAKTPEGPNKTVLAIAQHALTGGIAARRGQAETAIEHYTEAVRLEDSLPYMEPPYWYYPIRHSLGAVFLQAGRASEAEERYREDLKRFPENGWSLYGLAVSLRAQDKTEEAAQVEQRFRRAWSNAGIKLVASRF